MASLKDLAKAIETTKLSDSKAVELKGKNVRGPSLIPNQFYLGKTWKTTMQDSDNVFLALRFVGSGHLTDDDHKEMYKENPRLIDMKDGDRYWFERHQDGRNTEFAAFQSDECLCFGDPPVRLTFFEIKDVTLQTKTAKAERMRKAAEPAKAPAKKAAAKTPKKAAAKAVETEQESPAVPESKPESDDHVDAATESVDQEHAEDGAHVDQQGNLPDEQSEGNDGVDEASETQHEHEHEHVTAETGHEHSHN